MSPKFGPAEHCARRVRLDPHPYVPQANGSLWNWVIAHAGNQSLYRSDTSTHSPLPRRPIAPTHPPHRPHRCLPARPKWSTRRRRQACRANRATNRGTRHHDGRRLRRSLSSHSPGDASTWPCDQASACATPAALGVSTLTQLATPANSSLQVAHASYPRRCTPHRRSLDPSLLQVREDADNHRVVQRST